ncbi:MAG: glycosyltransferase family 4 protein [Bauldia sp.]|nr:glycosyltransferase family 4 protein [Bauldia sp.]
MSQSETMIPQSEPAESLAPLRVLVATPLGRRGQGGIDRLNDLIFDTIGRHPELGIRMNVLVSRGQGSILFAPFFLLRTLASLTTATLGGHADVLHIHLSSRGSTYRKLAIGGLARILKLPYVVHIHGSGFDVFWAGAGPRLAAAITRLLTRSAAVIVLGKYWADVVARHAPAAAGKIVVLPNATAPLAGRREAKREGPVHIVFLGAIGERKGTPQLVEALGRLADRGDWSATIAGNGDIDATRDQIARAGISNRVAVSGWLDPSKAQDVILSADIYVLPSFAENLPMSVLESMASGAAVVATPVGAVPEVIEDGVNGLLVQPGDVDGLTDAICRLLDDPILRRRIGDAGQRRHGEAFNIECYVLRLAEIWRQAAATRNTARPG